MWPLNNFDFYKPRVLCTQLTPSLLTQGAHGAFILLHRSAGAVMGFRAPVVFSISAKSLLSRIREMKTNLDELMNDAEALATAENEEWLTTAQFARLKGLTAKTVSNYAGSGKYKLVRRNEVGQWLIHKSELKSNHI